ncbi:mitochondrial ribosomal protein L50 [Brevipalpus obovatus]|uniref:mitochondrial ribosomal protein L50 n=1 Tax=Brevipalpus obovatus TaxID=246614 RepID=UPI003D9EEF9A
MSNAIASLTCRRYLYTSPIVYRYATTHPTGKKNIRRVERGTREGWMRVKAAGKEPQRLRVVNIMGRESNTSSADQGEAISMKNLERFFTIAKMRSHSRECKPYVPPEDYKEKIKTIAGDFFDIDEKKTGADGLEAWYDLSIEDLYIKHEFLNECGKQFDHEVPSPALHEMKKVGHVVHFYAQPVRGISKFDDLIKNQDQLPPNLTVISDYLRFNPETDKFFGGKDAYPKSPMITYGVRSKQKYENIKEKFEWPDV